MRMQDTQLILRIQSGDRTAGNGHADLPSARPQHHLLFHSAFLRFSFSKDFLPG